MRVISLLAIAFVFILTGCARTSSTSLVDPDYEQNAKFESVLVAGAGMPLDQLQIAEAQMATAVEEQGIRALKGTEVIPPTRNYTDLELADRILASGADAILILSAGQPETSEAYIPQQYHPGTTQSTVNVIGNTAFVNTYSTPGFTTGGFTVKKPRQRFFAQLIDVRQSKTAWIAELESRGGTLHSFSDLAESASQEVIAKLIEDGIL